MRITLASIFVEDQDRALQFYIQVLGFEKKHDIPLGPYRWLTLTSAEGVAGVELVLEPLAFPPARDYQKVQNHLKDKRVICLDIPDEFEFMDPELIRLFEMKVGPFFGRG